MTCTGFTYLFIEEQILFDNSNAGENFRVLLSPVLLEFAEAHALLSVHEKRQPHSILPYSGEVFGLLFVCHGDQCIPSVCFGFLGCFLLIAESGIKVDATTAGSINMCWLRGLTSSGKLAEYWFIILIETPCNPLILRGLSETLGELLPEGLSKQARNLII